MRSSPLSSPGDARYPVQVELDEYEVANLRAALHVLRGIGLDTGDWLGQILFKLPTTERLPNRAVSVQIAEVTR